MDHSNGYPQGVKKFESLDWGVVKRGALRRFVPSPGVRIEYGVGLVSCGAQRLLCPTVVKWLPQGGEDIVERGARAHGRCNLRRIGMVIAADVHGLALCGLHFFEDFLHVGFEFFRHGRKFFL